MNKVLIFEDRPERPRQYLSNNAFEELHRINDVNILSPKEISNGKDALNNGIDFLLASYQLICIHKSALNLVGLETVKRFCKNNNTNLVYFSGGISQIVFSGTEFPFIMLNSKDFYNSRILEFLVKFVQGGVRHLTEIAYGENWKLSLFLNFRQLLLKNSTARIELEQRIALAHILELPANIEMTELNHLISKRIKLL